MVEYRYAEEKPDRTLGLAAELVQLNLDLIFMAGLAMIRPVKKRTIYRVLNRQTDRSHNFCKRIAAAG